MDKRQRTYVRLIGAIRHALNQALTEEHARRGLTQADMARLLDRNPSFISRKLNGTSNMTLETLADLAYALDRPVRIALPAREAGKADITFHAAYRETKAGNIVAFPARKLESPFHVADRTLSPRREEAKGIRSRGTPW